jgi:hypothetical protein
LPKASVLNSGWRKRLTGSAHQADCHGVMLGCSLVAESDVRVIAFCPRPIALLGKQACQPTANQSFAPASTLISAALTISDDRY